MDSNVSAVLANLVGKVSVLAEKHNALASAKAEADARVAELESALADRERKLERLDAELQMLRTAAVLTPTKDQVERTRSIISELLKDIDRCIADFQE